MHRRACAVPEWQQISDCDESEYCEQSVCHPKLAPPDYHCPNRMTCVDVQPPYGFYECQ